MPSTVQQNLQQTIQTIRDLLSEIRTNAPQAQTSVDNLSASLDRISTSQLAQSTTTINKFFTDITTNANLSAKEVQELGTQLGNLYNQYGRFSNLIQGGGYGLGPSGLPLGSPTRTASTQELQRLVTQYQQQLYIKQQGIEIANAYTGSTPKTVGGVPSIGGVGPLSANYEQEAFSRYDRMRKLAQSLGQEQQFLASFAGQYKRIQELGRIGPSFTNTLGGGIGGPQPAKYLSDLFASGQSRFFSQAASQNIGGALQKYGFDPKTISTDQFKVYQELSSGISKISISQLDEATGVVRRATLTVDRFGNVLTDTQKRFRSFGDAIRRDTVEFLKWTIAGTLVIGTLRKVNELTETMVQNQNQLVDIQIATGQSTREVYTAFQVAADTANEVGETLRGTLETYVLAYRAAGSYSNEVQRTAEANALLRDSLVLSRLAGIQQAQAVDLLSGGLKQLNLDLSDGQILLDKWVAVTKGANVSMETLAQSFAITSSSAANVGLDIDELNGVIAATAEVTNLSATETGNMVRAIISGYQTDQAAQELARYGITIKDAGGEMRDFLDIFLEVKQRAEAGIISDKDVARISEVLGGGARRGAQVAAFIENISRVFQIRDISQFAEAGTAFDALQLKLQTVSGASTILQNAFIELAQTLGTEGGLLTTVSDTTRAMAGFVEIANGLVKALGTLTPALVAYLAVQQLVFASPGRLAGVEGALNTLGTKAGQATFGLLNRGPLTTRLLGGLSTRAAAGVANLIPGQGFGISTGQALAGAYAGYGAISNIREGDYAAAGGSIAGAIIGGLVTGGTPAGIAIGATMGTSFVNIVQSWADADFRSVLVNIFEDINQDMVEKRQQQLEGGKVELTPDKRLQNLEQKLQSTDTAKAYGVLYGLANALTLGNAENITGLTKEQFQLGAVLKLTPGALREYTQLARENFIDQYGLQGTLTGPGAFTNRLAGTINQINPRLDQFRAGRIDEAWGQFARNELSGSNLDNLLENLGEIQTTLGQIFTESSTGQSILDVFEQMYPNLVNDNNALEEFSNLLIELNPSQLQKLTERLGQVEILSNAIEQGSPEVGVDDLNDALGDAARLLGILQTGFNELEQAKIQLPGYFELDQDLTPFLQQIEQRALAIRDGMVQQLSEMLGIPVQDLIDTIGDLAIRSEGHIEDIVESISSYDLQTAIQQLIEEGVIPQIEDGLGFRQVDITSNQLPELQRLISYYSNLLTSAGVTLDEQTTALLFKDDVVKPISADLNVLQIALQELIDVNRKQLDGIYNLPTDATFFVPLAAAEIDRSTRDQLAAQEGTSIDSTSLDNSANNLDNSANVLLNAGNALQGAANFLGLKEYGPPTTFQGIERFLGLKQFGPPAPASLDYPQQPQYEGLPPYSEIYKFLPKLVPEYKPLEQPKLDVEPFLNKAFPDILGSLRVPVTADIALNSSTNVTLMIDRAVLAQIISQELGKAVATSRGLGGSRTTFQAI